MNYKIWGSVGCAVLLGSALISLSLFIGDRSAAPFNLVVIVVGFAAGWLLGLVISPYSRREQERFNKYASVFGVFVSGYLVSKADKLLEALFAPEFILDSVHGFRMLAFAAALMLGALVTFVFREYGE